MIVQVSQHQVLTQLILMDQLLVLVHQLHNQMGWNGAPGSAQEAVLRTLMAAQDLSEDGLLREDLLQQAQHFTGLPPNTFVMTWPPSLQRPGITLQNEPQIWSSIKSSLIEKGEKRIPYDPLLYY